MSPVQKKHAIMGPFVIVFFKIDFCYIFLTKKFSRKASNEKSV